MIEELKRCRLCNGEAKMHVQSGNVYISCKRCKIRTPEYDKCSYCELEKLSCNNCPPELLNEAKKAAIEFWNEEIGG